MMTVHPIRLQVSHPVKSVQWYIRHAGLELYMFREDEAVMGHPKSTLKLHLIQAGRDTPIRIGDELIIIKRTDATEDAVLRDPDGHLIHLVPTGSDFE